MNVSSRQLFAFLEACRLQSFAKAAERVHLSPSGMSMLVRELEEQVGARLFERTTRSVTLTEPGRRLQAAAERILDELRELGAEIGSTESAVRSRLDIAATPMVSASLLPAVVREFGTAFPGVHVRLVDVDVSIVRARVLEGEVDIGFGFFVKPAVGLLRQPLCKFRLMCVGPVGTATSGPGPSRTWRSLSGVPLISLPKDNPIQNLVETHLGRVGRAHEERPTMNLIGTLIAMVRAGMGHTIIPSFALEECLRQGLGVSMLVEPAVHLDLYLVSRRGAKPKPAALDFAAGVKRAAKRLAALPTG